MLEWNEYLGTLMKTQTVMDNVLLSYRDHENGAPISPLIKASILMLEDMISFQGNHNVFVFPEINQLSREFLISKVLFNILNAGKIQMTYDPEKFKPGQILKYKGCSVEFERIEDYNGISRIWVRFSDGMSYGVPIEIAPYFQISDSKRLSSYKRFSEKYSAYEAKADLMDPAQSRNFLQILENHKTHLNGSIFYVSGIKGAKDFLTSAEINNRKLTEVLYMAQTNGDGELTNLSAGQLSGNPAIIIASDLYAVQNSISKGVTPQSMIVDLSAVSIDRQLDVVDSLAQYRFPIVCITNTADSFELTPLTDRGYNLWRWDHDSITSAVQSEKDDKAETRARNCAQQEVIYHRLPEEYISTAVRLLYSQRTEVEDQNPRITTTFEKLFSFALLMLKMVTNPDARDKDKNRQLITDCKKAFEDNKRFISRDLYQNVTDAADSLMGICESDYKNPKFEYICDTLLSEGQYNSICIIIPERMDRSKIEKYWCGLGMPFKISVVYPQEYLDDKENTYDLAIISGWLGNKSMRQIIYGFLSKSYLVLTYPCEEPWKKSHTRYWKKSLDNSRNGEIIKKSFSKRGRLISTVRFEHVQEEEPVHVVDEFEEIEKVVRENKYKQYGGSGRASDSVEAYPVSFVGGYLAFYRTGHKALVATDIIANNGDSLKEKLPEKLEVGDFVLIRETERDIIREIADRILAAEKKTHLRALSSKWREALSVESLFSTPEEIYRKLCRHGCKKDYMTVKNWLNNEDLIQPGDKDDLLCIAEATGDMVLKEKLEEIYKAGKEVRRAHVNAGRILSQRLRIKISEHIRELNDIDAFNVWDPITLQLEDIGQVRILKVIDVSNRITIDIGNTNRLLTE